jgi:uncharacterized protein (DUF3084 family)
MDKNDDTIKPFEVDPQNSVIRNISALELTSLAHSTSQSRFSEQLNPHSPRTQSPNPQSSIAPFKETSFVFSGNKEELIKNEIQEHNAQLLAVEIGFLKQSISYLQGQIQNKSLEIGAKDDKINKLEKNIGKQKRKLKDLKSRVKFQDSKLKQLEHKLPKQSELVEKFREQEAQKMRFEAGRIKPEGWGFQVEGKKGQVNSSSPVPTTPGSPYGIGYLKMKRTN